ncbi:MAG: ribosome small subunit-dependent GTPase A [Rhodanobacteraceae bacterium]|nr:ribosome small subunit-dependent GTPase A [Xanthomonadales bacterium]MCP5477265.1 ribosome small subunit-dependent GTPase A [Rhodanobacteraceae bacterium]
MQLSPDQHEAFLAIGWRDDLPAAAAFADAVEGRLGRVIEQHRAGYRAAIGDDVLKAAAPAEWLQPRFDPVDRAAVGDWVLLDNHDVISRVLPRHSLLKRGAAGEHYRQQLIAANIDTVFVVSGLDGDFNPRRLQRYLLLVFGSADEGDRAQPVIVLTKADKALEGEQADPDMAARVEELRESLPDVPVLCVNAKSPDTVAALAPWLSKGQSVVLVGSSGAGKSTLTNTLLGIEKQATQSVREADSRGRHTTTSRSLIRLPDGACLIDTPGMRELKLTGEERLEDAGFEDIEQLATQCRFRDCVHQREPGCAIQKAIKDGELQAERWANYQKLQGELSDAAQTLKVRQEQKRDERVQTRALNKRLTDKYGRR